MEKIITGKVRKNLSEHTDRCDHIEKAMTVIKCTIIIATVITVISFLASAC